MVTINFKSNWFAYVLFGWLAAWLISSRSLGYLKAFSDLQLYMALIPLLFFGAIWSWALIKSAKMRFRWPLSLMITCLLALLTQWLFFLYLYARSEGLSMAHKAVYLYTDSNLWIFGPQVVFVSLFGMAQCRHEHSDGRFFWRFLYVPLLVLIGLGMWQSAPEILEEIEELNAEDNDSIACCDAVYGQLVDSNVLMEQGSISAIILSQQICQEKFGIVTTCSFISECTNSCSNRKNQCREKNPNGPCADQYWDCLSRCHKR